MTELIAAFADEPPPEDDPYHQAPPYDRQAEISVLGAMLRDPRAIAEISETLKGEQFYLPGHELIYDAIVRRFARLQPVDPHLLALDLEKTRDLRRVGGEDYLRDLERAGIAVPVDSAVYYADAIREQHARRRLVQAGERIIALGRHPGDTPIGELIDRAQTEVERERIAPPVPGVDEGETHPWQPMDLDPVLTGDLVLPRATLGCRRDGQGLLYPGAIHSIAGEPGCGKTWSAEIIGAQELLAGHPFGIVDFEDNAPTHVGRLRALGVPDEAIREGLRYVKPWSALDGAGWRILAKGLDDCRVITIDGVTEGMTLHGLEINDNADAARWVALLPLRLADSTGAAIVQIDHLPKDADKRGRYAIGAQHKLAAITGAAYKFQVIRSFGKGQHGHAKLIIDKDRHSDVGPTGATAADLHLDASDETGQILAWLDHPAQSFDDEGRWRPTILMGRVATFLEKSPGTTKNAIRAGVQGKGTKVDEALDCLIREGYIRLDPRPGGGSFHTLLRPFEEDS